MQELKFRVWNICLHKFLPVEDICISKASRLFFCGNVERIYAGERWFSPYECIIEQYTGLKDKDGKEIYEGDIIRCHGDGRFIAPVIRHAKSGGFCWVSCYDEICFIPESDEVEVIGNIHENPELYGKEEE